MAVVGAAVVAVLYRQLLSDVDAAAERRARDVVAGLQVDPVPELDAGLLATDGQIVAVQVVDDSSVRWCGPRRAPDKPMLSRLTARKSMARPQPRGGRFTASGQRSGWAT